jgi:hypothetical protein
VKKKEILVNGIVYFVVILISCFFARIFSNITVKIADLFVEQTFFSASGIRAVTLFLYSAFFTALFSYMIGYHTVCFQKSETLPASLVAVAFHFLLSLITLFSPWVAGATKHVGGFIAFGSRYTKAEHMLYIPIITLIIIGVVTALVYAGVFTMGVYVGTKKRLKDRAELMGEKVDEA